MAIKWFDLKEHGAKLERLEDSGGSHFLRLTFEQGIDPEKIKKAVEAGWRPDINQAGYVFTNYARFGKMTELVKLLSVFIDDEKILASKVDIGRLQQDELVLGFEDPQLNQTGSVLPDPRKIAGDLSSLPQEQMDRILSRVKAAQALVGVSPGADGSTLFKNDGVVLWRRLAEKFGFRDSTNAIASVVLAAQEKGENFDELHEKLMEAADTGASLPGMSRSEVYERKAAKITENLANNFKLFGHIDAGWGEQRFYRRFMSIIKCQYLVWDGARVNYTDNSEPPLTHGNQVRFAPALPVMWRHDLGHRIDDAIKFVASEVGTAPHKLFHGRKMTFHVGVTGNANTLGYHADVKAKIDGKAYETASIKISPFSAGVLVHEIGHGIDRAARLVPYSEGFDQDMVAALIDETGIRQVVEEQVQMGVSAGLISEEYGAYLATPDEIIARSFEAGIAELSFARGDYDFQKIGGVAMLSGGVNYQPGPEQALRFMNTLRQVVGASLERQAFYENDKASEPESVGLAL